MANIHPTAIVDKNAQIADDVSIGPFSVIGAKVVLKSGVQVMSHVCIEGDTIIGERTQIYPFCVIGFPPPDKKYQGEESKLVIGSDNVIREHVTIHTGTAVDRNETTIGDGCLLMANAHVAHDCIIGNNVIMANCAALAGHVVIEDNAILGGLSAVQQRVRIGANAILGGMTGLDSDLIPYGRAVGERASLEGINTIGLKRKSVDNAQILTINKAFKALFVDNGDVFETRLAKVAEEYKDNEMVMQIVDFIRSDMNKTLCKPETLNGAKDAA